MCSFLVIQYPPLICFTSNDNNITQSTNQCDAVRSVLLHLQPAIKAVEDFCHVAFLHYPKMGDALVLRVIADPILNERVYEGNQLLY